MWGGRPAIGVPDDSESRVGAVMRALDDNVRQDAVYGNKALGLTRLRSRGFAVPDAFVIAADEPIDEPGVWAAVETFSRRSGSAGRRLAGRQEFFCGGRQRHPIRGRAVHFVHRAVHAR